MLRCVLLLLILNTGESSLARDRASTSTPHRSINGAVRQKPALLLNRVLIDSSSIVSAPVLTQPLVIGPRLHRLDSNFSCCDRKVPELTHLRCRLVGKEVRFDAVGRGRGWNDSLANSKVTNRSEHVYIPKEGRFLYTSMSSGAQDVAGVPAIQNLQAILSSTPLLTLWSNSGFTIGKNLFSPEGSHYRCPPHGTTRSIASHTLTSGGLALTLIDRSQQRKGAWASLQTFYGEIFGGRSVTTLWQEAHNVIGSSIYRASSLNVPPGEYTFRAAGMTSSDDPSAASLEFAIRITPPFWEQPWFLPLVTACGVAFLVLGIVANTRRRTRRRLRELRFQNDLDRDRGRIARDMHDDLGARISVLSLNGSMALRDLDQNPDNARRLLENMNSSSREIVVAMDDLVWAVDPAYDNLDQFASHLTRMAEEIFRESPICCRLDIPTLLECRPLGLDFRYQLALAVKEALHNVLRHAGPCEVTLSLKIEGERLHIQVKDNGPGFEQDPGSPRHGLTNLKRRLKDLGGSCAITSASGEGTTIAFICSL